MYFGRWRCRTMLFTSCVYLQRPSNASRYSSAALCLSFCTPGGLAASALHIRRFMSSEAEMTNWESVLQSTALTCCMRLPWQTSLERTCPLSQMRTVLSVDPATRAAPVGAKSKSMTAAMKSCWMRRGLLMVRMSKWQMLASSLPTAKLSGSCGFQLRHRLLLGIAIFCRGESERRSNSMTEQSMPVQATTCFSLWLYFARITELAPHSWLETGLLRSQSHTCSRPPAVTNRLLSRLWSTVVSTTLLRNRSSGQGLSSSSTLAQSYRFTVLSSELERNLLPSVFSVRPFTARSWNTRLRVVFRSARSHTRISPSQAPDTTRCTFRGHFARQLIPSEWPGSAAMKGRAYILAILAALTARWYSLARAKGRLGSGLRCGMAVGDWVTTAIFTIC